jgi:hypothetical protein
MTTISVEPCGNPNCRNYLGNIFPDLTEEQINLHLPLFSSSDEKRIARSGHPELIRMLAQVPGITLLFVHRGRLGVVKAALAEWEVIEAVVMALLGDPGNICLRAQVAYGYVSNPKIVDIHIIPSISVVSRAEVTRPTWEPDKDIGQLGTKITQAVIHFVGERPIDWLLITPYKLGIHLKKDANRDPAFWLALCRDVAACLDEDCEVIESPFWFDGPGIPQEA